MHALRVPVAEADLPSLIERVAAGEQVILTRDGEAVAELQAPSQTSQPSLQAKEALRRLTELRTSLPPLPPGVSSVDLLREMHEEREEAIWPTTSTRAP
jgi:antitoxin (DNA-binding transcriptional repressor) of toxin-antitoxin stability system